jgi:hypothetical protein
MEGRSITSSNASTQPTLFACDADGLQGQRPSVTAGKITTNLGNIKLRNRSAIAAASRPALNGGVMGDRTIMNFKNFESF